MVEVTHSQKDSHEDVCCFESVVVAIVLKKGYVVVRGTLDRIFLTYPPGQVLETLFIHPRGLGLRGVWKTLHFVTIRLIYNTTVSRPRQALKSILIQNIQNIS